MYTKLQTHVGYTAQLQRTAMGGGICYGVASAGLSEHRISIGDHLYTNVRDDAS